MVIFVPIVLSSLCVYLFQMCFPRWNEWIKARTQFLLLPDYFPERCNGFVRPPTPFKCAIFPSMELCYHWVLSFVVIFALSNWGHWDSQDIGQESRERICKMKPRSRTAQKLRQMLHVRHSEWEDPWVCGGLAWVGNLESGGHQFSKCIVEPEACFYLRISFLF